MSEEEKSTENNQAKATMTKDRIDQALLSSRRIMIGRAFDNDLAEEVIKQLWYLELTDPGKPILLVINSPGGSVDSGFAIWDQIQLITSPVTTLITGLAASMGSVLSLAAAPNRRFATPLSRFMIHQPSVMGTIQGQATDLEIHAREILKTKEQLINIYTKATGKSREVIEKAIDRDTWMSAQEALEFGHIDKIITSFKDLEQ